ncbi:PQQ-dependent sugar dehydrogenase [Psychroserpens sp.]|uniref:PQQ-dependent sugar dehydrogenase n=1 Tax=Psychroserpens sp. TaxID=2020870 RepID=UPI001B03D0FA|nr:PQQ-dependent sugar dehydrogenase [Psychroserpens sp.]MBO6606360.1 PQQ-dependent sugar dehydrogenase [Psychroserpens sp.]MBO6631789.1 PQQ-dependent sugar dehydrogenase [Psychroserpens sp.]MBO6653064.1 PQQ-dependent sugar dehydrogenase [Psychroserpens sp.]MBO6680908.1 PQQ-dependent sugar dehydrogenase [Psychroserpens sp.]MBO6750134.1 PQQ-dependent sugar dehydrogenase [Psychroserpens sp.]
MNYLRYSVFLIVLIHFFACAQDKNPTNNDHHYELVVPQLTNPWGFVFLTDGSMLINEKSGKLFHFKNGRKKEISGFPDVYYRGQGGLLDIELHPDYANNGWIYFTYASPEGEQRGGHTALMRAKINNNQLVNQQVLYKASPNSTRGQHFGSRIVFDDAGFVYFTIGERGNRDVNPQDITRDGGKVYRLHDDGRIPADNPFVGRTNAKAAIYSYGHRNPQGMVIHPETRDIWTHEHGPKGGDEINIITAGKNYGWPIITYGVNYIGTKITDETSRPGMEQPLHYWVPSIAPSGMAFISSNNYDGWNGNLLVGSLKFQYLDNCYIENGKVVKEERLLDGIGRVRSIEQGPDGYIYVGVENLGIVKLIKD